MRVRVKVCVCVCKREGEGKRRESVCINKVVIVEGKKEANDRGLCCAMWRCWTPQLPSTLARAAG